MSKSNTLYFVENIIEVEKNELSEIFLWPITEINSDYFDSIEENNVLDVIHFTFVPTKAPRIKEGTFTYFNGDCRNPIFENANKDIKAKYLFYVNNIYRGLGIKRYREITNVKNEDEYFGNIYSYHVNVGHGNCSIISLNKNNETKIWVVDCSTYDFLNKKSYENNLAKCIDYIKNINNMNSFAIDKFFLTHPHFDHFNGLNYLFRNNYLTQSTKFWINFHYSWPGKEYNKTLKIVLESGCELIEPIFSNSTNNTTIIYPHNHIIRSRSIKYKYPAAHPLITGNYDVIMNANNASTVLKFKLNDKTMVFPGDIETEGLNRIEHCYPYMQNCDFYNISHHGSRTGYIRSNCPKGLSLNTIKECLQSVKKTILMGRNGAFQGIFNLEVLTDFVPDIVSSNPTTGIEPAFLQLDWQSDTIKYF